MACAPVAACGATTNALTVAPRQRQAAGSSRGVVRWHSPRLRGCRGSVLVCLPTAPQATSGRFQTGCSGPWASLRVHSQKPGTSEWKDLLGEELWAPQTSDYHIRPIRDMEWPEVADIQAAAFHTPMKLGMLNAVAYNSFRAEVRAALSQKLKYANPQTFRCLVAANENSQPVGVVEVSILDDPEILARLGEPRFKAYVYISSMAVREGDRRTGVASALLSAAEQVGKKWGHVVAVLDVYEDNLPGVGLYQSRGYVSASEDPDWMKLVGRRKRLHMHKLLTESTD